MTRASVYKLIDGERDYQVGLFASGGRFEGDADGEPGHEVGEHLTILRSYVRKAEDAWTDEAGSDSALEIIRKLAAVAVRCMEEHETKPRIA